MKVIENGEQDRFGKHPIILMQTDWRKKSCR